MLMAEMNIYIVDDDDAFAKSLKRLLQSAGYITDVFSSAQSFLDSVPVYYKKGILILDLRMPGMNGFQLQEKLKELRSDLEIIFVTADAQPGDRDHAMKSGAIAFLQKPFQEESLFEMIDKALNKYEVEPADRKKNEQEF
jgi:FixJ family two-component response regulator